MQNRVNSCTVRVKCNDRKSKKGVQYQRSSSPSTAQRQHVLLLKKLVNFMQYSSESEPKHNTGRNSQRTVDDAAQVISAEHATAMTKENRNTNHERTLRC